MAQPSYLERKLRLRGSNIPKALVTQRCLDSMGPPAHMPVHAHTLCWDSLGRSGVMSSETEAVNSIGKSPAGTGANPGELGQRQAPERIRTKTLQTCLTLVAGDRADL